MAMWNTMPIGSGNADDDWKGWAQWMRQQVRPVLGRSVAMSSVVGIFAAMITAIVVVYYLNARPNMFDVICPSVDRTSQDNILDRFMANVWLPEHFKVNGVFIEIGAHNGKEDSNTWFLEKCLGWSGFLIEGHPATFDLCQENRDNKCILSSVCRQEENGYIEFVGPVNDRSAGGKQFLEPNLLERYRNAPRWKSPCKPFHRILSDYMPDVGPIDFWSLDIEGAEMIALDTHDWIKNPVHFLFMEDSKKERGHPTDSQEVRNAFLESKCMKKINYNFVYNTGWENPRFPLPACSEP